MLYLYLIKLSFKLYLDLDLFCRISALFSRQTPKLFLDFYFYFAAFQHFFAGKPPALYLDLFCRISAFSSRQTPDREERQAVQLG